MTKTEGEDKKIDDSEEEEEEETPGLQFVIKYSIFHVYIAKIFSW